VTGVSLTFLGTGTSVGVPVIGCDCAVCQSPDPANNRTRSSVLYRAPGATLLVDSGPDLRQQALRENLREVDAVLYTHAHLDHIAGFDELRAFCWRRDLPLPLHASAECMKSLRQMFGWAFSAENTYRGYIKPAPHIIDGPFLHQDIRITPLPVEHAALETIGFLFERPGCRSVAYLPDVKRIPPATASLIHGVDVLIVDALRPASHPTHFCVAESLAAIEAACPGEAWLTHLGHENDHQSLQRSLPAGVRVALDGLQLPLADLA
jgi:phosphoribosyl 1,2-cyclic phosphate phosphodiesterase